MKVERMGTWERLTTVSEGERDSLATHLRVSVGGSWENDPTSKKH